MDDAVLYHSLQLLLGNAECRLHLVQGVHEIRPRDLDILDVLKGCNGADLHQSGIRAEILSVPTLTCRLKAKLVALLTKPPISAPEKFLVNDASSAKSTSFAMTPLFFILDVWILSICRRPCSSGSEISMWTSRRPGRSKASSIMSIRFVIPIIKTLLSWSTPSIYEVSNHHEDFANLRKQLIDDGIADTGTVVRRTTLFADGVELIEDYDVKPALMAFLLFLSESARA